MRWLVTREGRLMPWMEDRLIGLVTMYSWCCFYHDLSWTLPWNLEYTVWIMRRRYLWCPCHMNCFLSCLFYVLHLFVFPSSDNMHFSLLDSCFWLWLDLSFHAIYSSVFSSCFFDDFYITYCGFIYIMYAFFHLYLLCDLILLSFLCMFPVWIWVLDLFRCFIEMIGVSFLE